RIPGRIVQPSREADKDRSGSADGAEAIPVRSRTKAVAVSAIADESAPARPRCADYRSGQLASIQAFRDRRERSRGRDCDQSAVWRRRRKGHPGEFSRGQENLGNCAALSPTDNAETASAREVRISARTRGGGRS